MGTLHEYVNTFISYLFYVTMRNVSEKIVEKIKRHVLCSIMFFPKIVRLVGKCRKRCTAGEATDGNMTHAQCRLIPKTTYTLSDYVILIAFHRNNGWTNAPLFYVIRTLAILLTFTLFMRCDTVFVGKFLVKFRKILLSSASRKGINYWFVVFSVT